MQARSALFDLYGDYLRSRGGRAPVAALVKLLAPVGIAPPAVRLQQEVDVWTPLVTDTTWGFQVPDAVATFIQEGRTWRRCCKV